MKKNIGEQMLPTCSIRFHTQFMVDFVCYPPVNQHNYGKSPFLMDKSTINGHYQYLCLFTRGQFLNMKAVHTRSPVIFVVGRQYRRKSPHFCVDRCPVFWGLKTTLENYPLEFNIAIEAMAHLQLIYVDSHRMFGKYQHPWDEKSQYPWQI